MCTKVSIIIPVYNVEQYIERCARSLFEQTLDNIEYIFVNDCTPDHSISILNNVINEFPERRDYVKIINLPNNSGSAVARSIGIAKATGEFIGACDSDDWVEKDTFQIMYDAATTSKSDIAVCDYSITDGNNKTVYQSMNQGEKNGFIEDMLYHKVSWSVCNKLFKRSLFNDSIIYPQKSMGDDFVLTLQLVYYCHEITYVNFPLYNYYQHSQSITHAKKKEGVYKNFQQAMANTKIIIEFFRKKGIFDAFEGGLANLKYQTKSLLLPITNDTKYKNIWNSTFPNVEKQILFDKKNPLKERVKCLLIILKIYPKVTNFLRITHCK